MAIYPANESSIVIPVASVANAVAPAVAPPVDKSVTTVEVVGTDVCPPVKPVVSTLLPTSTQFQPLGL